MVASHLSGERSSRKAIALFEKSMKIAKKKPVAIYIDGLPAWTLTTKFSGHCEKKPDLN